MRWLHQVAHWIFGCPGRTVVATRWYDDGGGTNHLIVTLRCAVAVCDRVSSSHCRGVYCVPIHLNSIDWLDWRP